MTLLAVFEPEEFQSVILPILNLKIKEKVEILKHLPQFAQLSRKQISIFCAACMEVTARRGQILFEEGESAAYLFILYNGTIEYTKDCNG
jgi:hypothetical protein